MTQAEQRGAVLVEAAKWIGTPYRHRGGILGVGVDCAMLLARVYAGAGLIPAGYDPGDYPPDWHLHQAGERFLGFVMDLGAKEVQAPLPGDVVVWRIGRCFAHGGIVTDWPFVIHAYAKARQVQRDDTSLGGELSDVRHPKRFFTFWPHA